MARGEIGYLDNASLGDDCAEVFFQLGMTYAAGSSVAIDFIAAHKWFNIAAMRGSQNAARLRREIAEQMTDAEIGAAQRAARDWLAANPMPAADTVARAAA